MTATRIEDGSRIERSVIMNNDTISEDCEIEDSVLSQRLVGRAFECFEYMLSESAKRSREGEELQLF